MMVVEQAIQPRDAHALRHFEKNREQLRRHPRVAEPAMASFERKPEMLREQVEPAALERRHEPARHLERAQHRVGQPDAKDAAVFEVEKSKIESRVVRDHHPLPHELAKPGQHVLDRRRLAHHLRRNRREPRDKARNDAAMRTHQGRKRFGEPPPDHPVRADLDDRARAGASSRGFQIDHRELGLIEPNADAVAIRQPPPLRVSVEDEIWIAAE